MARHKSNAGYGNYFAARKVKAQDQIARSGHLPVAKEPGLNANDLAGQWLKANGRPPASFWRKVKKARKTRKRLEKRARVRQRDGAAHVR